MSAFRKNTGPQGIEILLLVLLVFLIGLFLFVIL